MLITILSDGIKTLDEIIFLDIKSKSDVKVILKRNIFKFFLFRFVLTLYFSNKKIFNFIPFRFSFYKFLLKKINFDITKKNYFLITIGWYNINFINYLNHLIGKDNLMFFFSDSINSKILAINNFSIQFLIQKIKYIFTYSVSDADKYNLIYFPLPYSKFKIEKNVGFIENKFDFIFVGAARNRLNILIDIYKQLSKYSNKIFFYIYNNKINYKDNHGLIFSKKLLTYKKYLFLLLQSKVIIEVLDSNDSGSTLRFWEAIVYNKKLITNNKDVLKSKFYDAKKILLVQNFSQLKEDFLLDSNTITYNYKNENSPIVFYNYLKNILR